MRCAGSVVWALLPVIAAVMLLVAGVGKVLSYEVFEEAVAAHGVVSPRLMGMVWLVPAGEVGLAIWGLWALGSDASRRVPVLVLVGVYGVLGAYALRLHAHPPPTPAPCGCGWSTRPVERWLDLAIQNGAIAAGLSAALVLRPRGSTRADRGG